MFRKLIATAPRWMTVPLRIGLGLIFIGHGSQKVLGWFGGPGLSKWMTFEKMAVGLRPTGLWLAAAAFSELLGGLLVLLGLLTRLGALMIAATMTVAIIGMHWPNFFSQNQGMEFPLALLAMALALIIAGGGQASVDQMLMRGRR